MQSRQTKVGHNQHNLRHNYKTFFTRFISYTFLLQFFSLLIFRLYTDFKLHTNPGAGRQVCGGGGVMS